MNIKTIKSKLLRLRNSLARQSFGTEVKIFKNGIFIAIKTTEEIGPISRKEITAQVEVNSSFLSLGVLDQERMLIKELKNVLNVL